MSRFLAWLAYLWRRHRLIRLLWLTGYNIVYYAIGRKGRTGAWRHPDPFDEKYGTDTRGIREIRSLDVLALPAARYAVRYGPSNARSVRATLEKLPIEYAQYTFVDYGSGKGRVLFVAAGFPFKEIIGIELSRELHDVAVQNIALLPPDITKCATVRSIHGDAALFEPPKTDLVCYFYNPFEGPVVAAVATRLVAHHEQCGSRIIVIYVDPQHREIFEETGKFTILDETPNALVLTTPLEAGEATIDLP
jgi:SAM-dependent methyltransferase